MDLRLTDKGALYKRTEGDVIVPGDTQIKCLGLVKKVWFVDDRYAEPYEEMTLQDILTESGKDVVSIVGDAQRGVATLEGFRLTQPRFSRSHFV